MRTSNAFPRFWLLVLSYASGRSLCAALLHPTNENKMELLCIRAGVHLPVNLVPASAEVAEEMEEYKP